MIINDTIYFDIEIGEYNNFLRYSDLLSFQMVETAGVALPYFHVSFRTSNVSIKNKIIENNVVIIKIGESADKADIFNVHIAGHESKQDESGNYFVITFSGFIKDKKFLIERKIECYEGTSLEVLSQLAINYLGNELSTSITGVSDMASKWRRCNETEQVFMSELWLHMNLAPSTPLFAINKYGIPILEDLNTLKTMSPKWIFTPVKSNIPNEVTYYNKFKPKSYKFSSNLYAGYGRVISIPTTETGNYDVIINDNEPELAAAQTGESTNSGSTMFEGFYNNANGHNKYHQCYFHNSSKLVDMSSIIGELSLLGYYKKLNLLDLVSVTLGDRSDPSIGGKYIIDTISVDFQYNSPIKTTVHVTRDNSNGVENYLIDSDKKLNISNSQKSDFLTSIRNLRSVVSFARNFMEGATLQNITTYATSLKYGVLTSFSVAGTSLNLNSQLEALNSIKNIGNAILNSIINTYVPPPFNDLLQNFAIQNYSLLSYFLQLVNSFPISAEFQSLLADLVGLMADCTNNLQIVSNNNSVSVAENTVVGILSDSTSSSISYTDTVNGVTNININVGSDMESNTDIIRINNIVDGFEDNLTGADIPIVVPDLTSSQLLMTTEDLQNLIADNIVDDLTERGYLTGVDNFKDILLGNLPLDFNTINIINNNTGALLKTRHWGSFNGEAELTDYFIRKCFKEKYKTIPVTKLINAKGGKQIFFALPSSEKNLKFYINSTKVNMQTMNIYLGYTDIYKNDVLYTVYYSSSDNLYNSNSVIVECRG